MALFSGIHISGTKSEDVADAVIALNRDLEYQLANLDSRNILEVGGWKIDDTSLASKDFNVGMSTDNTAPNPVRFWAGGPKDSAPFRVHQDGSVIITDATISWGATNAPLYSDVLGTKPPANADNTDTTITAGGSNFTKVAGAYVYSGPANYSQISGGPPSNADNTAANLAPSLGINFTKIGSDYIYTGTLNANQINAGTINANYINGGTLTGIVYNAYDPATPNRRLQIRPLNTNGVPDLTWWNDLSTTQERGSIYLTTGNFQSDGTGTHTYFSLWGTDRMQITSPYVWFNAGTVDFGGATIVGMNTTAKFG